MLRKKPSAHFSPVSSQSSSRSRSPAPVDWDADDEAGTMSGDDFASSRPAPITIPGSCHSSHATWNAKRPSLKEILSNSSPPPWTLTAFMAYLSNNHCLETLEFTMDAARYKKHYAKIVAKSEGQTLSSEDAANINVLWSRLIEAYIRPNGSREINIPSEVRDPILHFDSSIRPPPPETLDVAVKKVYELMEESVLVPFLNTMTPPVSSSPPATGCECDPDSTTQREDWFKFRVGRFGKNSPPSTSPNESPPAFSSFPTSSSRKSQPSLSNAMHRHRMSSRQSPTNSAIQSTISQPGDSMIVMPSLTDDSGYTSSHTNESLSTPPLSPPEDELGLSPRSSRESGWKKFGRLSQWKGMKKRSQQNFSESMP